MRRVVSFFWSRLEQIGFFPHVLICSIAILWVSAAIAQNMPIYQTGPLTPGHALRATTNGVAQDAGSAQNGNLTEMGITNAGLPSCVRANDPASGGYRLLCVGADATVGTSGSPSGGGGAVVGPATTTVGNCAVWANTTGTLLSDGPCPGYINPQVPPYSCKGDGVTDDTTCFQAALTAAGLIGGTIEIFPNALFYITSTLSDGGRPVIIHGNNPTNGNDNGACTSGFTDVAAGVPSNINLLMLNGTGSKIDHTCFLMGAASSQATAGAALTIGAASGSKAANQSATFNVIKFPYVGIDVGGATGGGVGQNGSTSATSLYNNWVVSPSGWGIRVGFSSDNSSTVGVRLDNNNISCAGTLATYAVALYDAAIDDYSGNDLNTCQNGLGILPGTVAGSSQFVLGFFKGVVGDSNSVHQLLIKPQTTNGKAIYLSFTNFWAAANQGASGSTIMVDNTAGGTISNVSFTGGTAHGANNSGGPQNVFDIEGCVSGISIVGNNIAADGGGNNDTGVYDNNQCEDTLINSNKFTPNLGQLQIGIHVASTASPNGTTIVGNNLSTSAIPIQFDPTVINFVMTEASNTPLSSNSQNVAVASTIAAPMLDQFFLTGSGTVNVMTGWWQTREVRMRVNTSGVVFASGGGTGGFCSALTTSAAAQIVEAWWNPNLSCWDLK